MGKRPRSILEQETTASQKRNSKSCTAKKRSKSVALRPDEAAAQRSKPVPAAKPQANTGGQITQFWGCHSIVDRQAVSALVRLLAADKTHRKGASLKSLTLAPHIQAKQATYAVTVKTLEHLAEIKDVVQHTGLLLLPRLQPEAAYVLVYELLFGEGLKPNGPAERAVLAASDTLQAALAALHKTSQPEPSIPALTAPRAARVNTLKMTVAEALSWLRRPPKSAGVAPWKDVQPDQLLPDVLLFPPDTDLHDHPLVQNSSIVLQSKASCMPAHALNPQPGWMVLDACAAPGNKTTHIAALMDNRGTLLAFDKDSKRLERLRANKKATGATCIRAEQGDFLELDPTSPAFANVRGLLLDPSCSGSGMVHSRMDHLLPSFQENGGRHDAQRVARLAKFQQRCLVHALRFPALQRLVYSTCSVHTAENEEVVAAVLEEASQAGLTLVDPFPGWHRRGLPLVTGHELLVRTDPDADGTDGFFVAVFERRQ